MTNTTKIRRNSKRYAAALETASDVRVYTLSNCFVGADCNTLALVRYMTKGSVLGQCELTTDGEGNYTLHVHSNCWFTFKAADACDYDRDTGESREAREHGGVHGLI